MTTRVDDPTRSDIAEEIRRMGHRFDQSVLEATYALFEPLQEKAPKDGIEVLMDVAYGPDERHRLDIFTPARWPAGPAPVVVYIHGGGFVGGSKNPVPGLIYDNVPTFFARNGLIGVNATYRLAPEHKWPTGAADVGAAVGWLRENVSDHGGDPERIFLMGQSAGASHVADYTFNERVHGAGGPRIAGAILASGVYAPLDADYSAGEPGPNLVAYYGDDLGRWRDMSSLYHVKAGHPPVFVTVAEYDPYPLAWPSAAMLARLVQCDRVLPRFTRLDNHNHVSPTLQINSEIDTLGPAILDFVVTGR